MKMGILDVCPTLPMRGESFWLWSLKVRRKNRSVWWV